MKWMLALDMGNTSIGWWVYEVIADGKGGWQPVASIDGGVRIFSDGREPSSLGRVGDSRAVSRRTARGMRRNRDHHRVRIKALVNCLIENGLLPASKSARDALFITPSKTAGDPDANNPYRLRAVAAEEKLPPHPLGRVLFHLGLRRGYKSNRKEASDDEGGKLKDRMAAMQAKLAGKTLGQFLWAELSHENTKGTDGPLEGRPKPIRFADGNPFYPSRAMYEAEFERIKAVQAPHLALDEPTWQRLAALILEQRPLKPVERGRCEFFISEPRHWRDTPTGHDFRIHQEMNNLRVVDSKLENHLLTHEQRAAVLGKLMSQKTVTFGALRKLKDTAGNKLFPHSSRFNLEGEKRKGLNGHKVAVEMKANPLLAPIWQKYSENTDSSRLDEVFTLLFEAEDDTSATAKLQEDFDFDTDTAEALTALKLGRATASLSLKAMHQLVSIMRDQGLEYWEAVGEVCDENGEPLHHSNRTGTVRFARLPYYGKVMPENMLGANPEFPEKENPEKHFGRINNPSVHVALNQLHKLVNTLTDRFESAPVKSHVEMTRDLKKPKKIREELERNQAKGERYNNEIRNLLANEHGIYSPSMQDIKKYKLWEELGKNSIARQCPFSGKTISANQLFNGDVEIEHILPFSRTLDNSMSNQTVAFRWANQLKGSKSPFEAFGTGTFAGKNILWDEILQRIKSLPKNKRWRFGPDAMERYDEDSGFIARQLTDTAYMARISRRYLLSLRGVEDVFSLPGQLTALVRGKWRLNGILADDSKKSREDHRHHAVDAAVIGLIDRNLLQGISNLSKRGVDHRLHIHVPPLDERLEQAIRARVPAILPSFKPDHGLGGKMFKETAYGFTEVEGEVVTRKPLTALKPAEIGQICDENIRDELSYRIKTHDEKPEKILAEFSEEFGIKRVRLLVKDQTVKPVPSAPYKGYRPDSYVCCDIWRLPPKKKGGRHTYEGRFWNYVEVMQKNGATTPNKLAKKPHPAAKYITRVFKDDLIELGAPGSGEILKVAGFSTTNNKLDVRPPEVAQSKQIYKSINQLAADGLRRLYVSPDGRVLRGGRQ